MRNKLLYLPAALLSVPLSADPDISTLSDSIADGESIDISRAPAESSVETLETEVTQVAQPLPAELDFQLFSSSYRHLIGNQPSISSLGDKFGGIGVFPVASSFDMSELSMSMGLWSLQGENPLSLDVTSNYWQRNLPLTPAGMGWDGQTESGAGMGLGMTVRPLDAFALEISGHNLVGILPDSHWSNGITQEWRWRGSRYWQLSGELVPVNGWSLSLGYRQDTANKENQFLLGTGFELSDRVLLDFTGTMTQEQALEAIFRTSVSF